jgi:hypothetical protein
MKKDRCELEQLIAKENNCSTTVGSTPNNNFTDIKLNRKSFIDFRRNGNKECSTMNFADPTIQRTTTAYAINEFRKQALSVNRSDFKKIDYMIRKGEKQIKLLRMPGVKLVRTTGPNIGTSNIIV